MTTAFFSTTFIGTTSSATRTRSSAGPADVLSSGRRALVLAGGGAAGNAWELGLLAGLAEAGLDVTAADLVIGTSAGATVAAQVTSGTPLSELYAAVLAEAHQRPVRPTRAAARPSGSGPRVSGQAYLEWSDAIIRDSSDPTDMRRRMGAAALLRDTSDGADGARWRDVVAARLTTSAWPDRAVLVTAVDARTGEPVAFDRDSGVDLVDAVAASTSAMTPYPIGEDRFINGGYRRSENADLAAGCGRVLVLSPFGGRSRMPRAWGMDLGAQVAELRAGGSTVESVFPDSSAGDVFDANALDPSTRPQAARGGHAQGLALAVVLSDLWH